MLREQLRCLCCDGTLLTRFLVLGDQCPCNAFHSPGETVPTFPLQANLCAECLHGQLRYMVSPDVLFANYAYRTRISRTLVDHFEQLAREICTANRVGEVLDVGCNDGTLLNGFKKMGCRTWGLDPIDLHDRRGTDVFVQGYCDISTVVREKLAGFDVVTATNVLAHAADPRAFLLACERMIAPQGTIVVEVPYALEMLAQNQFDTVYFEHVSYFTLSSLCRLAASANLRIDSVHEIGIHGGSLRIAMKRSGGRALHCDDAARLCERERGLVLVLAQNAQARADQVCGELRDMVSVQRAKGRRVVGFGASGKSSIVLNAAQVDLDFIVDQTPAKIGKLSPGRDIPIIDLTQLPSDNVPTDHVILAWNCLDECLAKIRSVRTGGTQDGMIVYVPNVCWRPLFDVRSKRDDLSHVQPSAVHFHSTLREAM